MLMQEATTWQQDSNLALPTGKPGVYESIGVREYLVFDPTDEIIGGTVWARRASPTGFVPWEPDDNGRWSSDALGIAFEPRGVLLRVYDQDGRLVPVIDEFANLLEERDRRLAELEAELRRLRGE